MTEMLIGFGILVGLFCALWWGWGRKPPPDEPTQGER